MHGDAILEVTFSPVTGYAILISENAGPVNLIGLYITFDGHAILDFKDYFTGDRFRNSHFWNICHRNILSARSRDKFHHIGLSFYSCISVFSNGPVASVRRSYRRDRGSIPRKTFFILLGQLFFCEGRVIVLVHDNSTKDK